MSKKIFTDSNGRQYYQDENKIRVYDGNKEVGQLSLGTLKKGAVCTINDIGVSQEYQRQGVGATLTSLAEQIALKEGASGIGVLGQPDYLELLEARGYKIEENFATKKFSPNSELEGQGNLPRRTAPTVQKDVLLRIIGKLGGGGENKA